MLKEQGIGWRNANRYRAYPFVDDSDFELSDTTLLPTDAVLDISAVVYAGVTPVLYLTSIEHIPEHDVDGYPVPETWKVTFELGTWNPVIEIPAMAALEFPFVVNESGFRLEVLFGDGLFNVGDVTCRIPVQPVLVVAQNNHQVRSVSGDPLQAYHVALTGRIYAQEGYNCRLDLVQDTLPTLRISAIYGEGDGIVCDPMALNSCEDVIARINGLTPSTEGDFQLVGGKGVDVAVPQDRPYTLVLSISKPADKIGCQNVT